MSQLEIHLLGELTVCRGGVRLPMPQSRKTRALLAYLILNPGPQRRDRLCEMFWQVPDDPRGALRWSLSKLRGLVNEPGAERLRADRERVAFHPEDVQVDVTDVRERLDAGAQALPTQELADLAGTLAAELLEGLDLPDQPDFHYFLAGERQQLLALRLEVLRALTDRHAESPAEAVPWLQAQVEAEPYDAEAHRRLIEALAMAGRRRDAERQKSVSLECLGRVSEADAVALQRAVHARPAVGRTGYQADERALEQEIRFCKAADGVQIAYACVGEGPPLVKCANWLNHLEYDWESPVWRHMFRGLADGRKLIRYDARGNGLSDWDVDEWSLDAMVNDLEAVVDAAGLDRFPLLGISQGCAVSVEYAVRHPERITRLVLVGGYARGWHKLGSKEIDRQTEAMITLVRIGWGQDNPAFRQLFTSLFMPDAPSENQAWFNELQRLTTSPDNAVRLLRACGDVDIRHRLSEVRAPTLVMHARHDMRVPYSSGRELAGGIPGARFVSLETRNHVLPETDPAWPRLLAEINRFLRD